MRSWELYDHGLKRFYWQCEALVTKIKIDDKSHYRQEVHLIKSMKRVPSLQSSQVALMN